MYFGSASDNRKIRKKPKSQTKSKIEIEFRKPSKSGDYEMQKKH
jgi:hypothetical protein